MNHSQYRERLKEYSLNTGHDVHYHDSGIMKQQPKVPRNKNPNKIWDGSETVAINARHK
jgi:hypothetical protein